MQVIVQWFERALLDINDSTNLVSSKIPEKIRMPYYKKNIFGCFYLFLALALNESIIRGV